MKVTRRQLRRLIAEQIAASSGANKLRVTYQRLGNMKLGLLETGLGSDISAFKSIDMLKSAPIINIDMEAYRADQKAYLASTCKKNNLAGLIYQRTSVQKSAVSDADPGGRVYLYVLKDNIITKINQDDVDDINNPEQVLEELLRKYKEGSEK